MDWHHYDNAHINKREKKKEFMSPETSKKKNRRYEKLSLKASLDHIVSQQPYSSFVYNHRLKI